MGTVIGIGVFLGVGLILLPRDRIELEILYYSVQALAYVVLIYSFFRLKHRPVMFYLKKDSEPKVLTLFHEKGYGFEDRVGDTLYLFKKRNWLEWWKVSIKETPHALEVHTLEYLGEMEEEIAEMSIKPIPFPRSARRWLLQRFDD